MCIKCFEAAQESKYQLSLPVTHRWLRRSYLLGRGILTLWAAVLVLAIGWVLKFFFGVA